MGCACASSHHIVLHRVVSYRICARLALEDVDAVQVAVVREVDAAHRVWVQLEAALPVHPHLRREAAGCSSREERQCAAKRKGMLGVFLRLLPHVRVFCITGSANRWEGAQKSSGRGMAERRTGSGAKGVHSCGWVSCTAGRLAVAKRV